MLGKRLKYNQVKGVYIKYVEGGGREGFTNFSRNIL